MVWYEEMKKDLIAVIKDMSKFLGYHLTELKVNTFYLHTHLQIIVFKNTPVTIGTCLFCKGTVMFMYTCNSVEILMQPQYTYIHVHYDF
jgi:hypothetical protein